MDTSDGGEVTMQNRASRKRSVVKAITYRGIIVALDFLVIYLLTGKVMTAAAFMIVSNIYTTVAYSVHERVWVGIKWGIGASETQLILHLDHDGWKASAK